ncbi:MAG: hypothetical protein LC540_17505 [Candidatus Thiodiazotropha sp.]|nr:hypothetical protein [Candidatus Thiodiazotropha sp.]
MSLLSNKRPTQKRESAAKKIIEGEGWKTTDPDAPATKIADKYVNAFLLRLNEWEMGALTEAAKGQGRSAQQQARLMLRQALKVMISK